MMKNTARSVAVALSSVIGLWCVYSVRGAEQPAAPSSAKAPPTIQDFSEAVALEKAMPEYEKVADEADKVIKPFLGSSDPRVALAADAALLRIRAIRDCRQVLIKSPGYVKWHLGPARLAAWKSGLEYYLQCAKVGKDPYEGMLSGVRPFRTKADGQLLLYPFRLPKDYDPAKKYPLIVDLHAGAGFAWLCGWVDGKPSSDPRSARSDGCISISPAGRQHGGAGEVAILDAIADARKHYSVDENRIRIGGASYGGSGGYHLATFYPDLFAAAWSLTGGGNYGYVANNGLWDAYLLGDNLCNLGWLTWDTPGDGHYKANHEFAEGLRQRAAKYPGYYANLELTDPKGGHGIIARDLIAEGQAWMAKQVRNSWPKLVIYKTYGLRYDGAYWARIDTMEDPTKPARIEAQVSEDGSQCRVAIENADRFHLDLDRQLVGGASEVRVGINGGEAMKVPAGKTAYFAKADGKWTLSVQRYPAGLIKKHGLSGPIADTFMGHDPFVFVYGTADSKDQAVGGKVAEAILTQLFGPGDGSSGKGFYRDAMEVKADSQVTEADIATKHLVLIGTTAQNRLTAKIADRLPVKFRDDGFALGGKQFREKNLVLAMIYPNPLNPQRYVLVMTENYRFGRSWECPDRRFSQPALAPGALRFRRS